MSAAALLAIIRGLDRGLVEVRYALRRGMGQEFYRPADPRLLLRLAELGERSDTYVGATLRTHEHGGRQAIKRANCLWADCDGADATASLQIFGLAPTLTVRSGSGDNLHAWWALKHPVSVEWTQRANRRLAHALGADMRATDIARILRVPGTLNFKHDPPASVETIQHEPANLYGIAELVANLPDPPLKKRPPRRPRPVMGSLGDPLKAIPSETYYERLTGREAPRGNVSCPFHKDGMERNPSMTLYREGTWYCHVCQEGGSIYDFAGKLWGLSTRGDDFRQLHARLRQEFSL